MFAFIDAHLILSIFLFLIFEFFAALFGWFIGTFILSLFSCSYVNFYEDGNDICGYIINIPIFAFLFRIGLYILGRFITPMWLRVILLLISSFFVLFCANLLICLIDYKKEDIYEKYINIFLSPNFFKNFLYIYLIYSKNKNRYF